MNLPPFIVKMLQMRRENENHSMAEWQRIKAAEGRRREVVSEMNRVIKETFQRYRRAIHNLTGKELENFTRYQSPRHILAIDPRLKYLANHLRDQQTWDMLSRADRRLVAQACQLAGIQP